MTASPALAFWKWMQDYQQQLLTAQSIRDVKRIYLKTMHPDGKITESQRDILAKVPWERIYKWVNEQRAEKGVMI